MTRLEDIRLERHPAGGYGYLTWHGTYYRIVREDVADERGKVLTSKRRWTVLDNGNALDCFDSLSDARRWLQQRT